MRSISCAIPLLVFALLCPHRGQARDIDQRTLLERSYRESLARDPANAITLEKLGELLSERGAYIPAISFLEQARALHPRSRSILQKLAFNYQVAGKLNQAKSLYRALLAASPRNSMALFNLGVIALSEQDEDSAMAFFERSRRADKKSASAVFALAELYQRRDCARAVPLYREALVRQPNAALAHLRKGQCLKRLGRLPEAAAELRAFIGRVMREKQWREQRMAAENDLAVINLIRRER